VYSFWKELWTTQLAKASQLWEKVKLHEWRDFFCNSPIQAMLQDITMIQRMKFHSPIIDDYVIVWDECHCHCCHNLPTPI
jgi:hypothetical protein